MRDGQVAYLSTLGIYLKGVYMVDRKVPLYFIDTDEASLLRTHNKTLLVGSQTRNFSFTSVIFLLVTYDHKFLVR